MEISHWKGKMDLTHLKQCQSTLKHSEAYQLLELYLT